MTKRRTIIALTLIAAVGFALRATSNSGQLLWQDEAETTINSLQVIDHGYPSDTFKGKPLYENASYVPSDDPKYAFQSTNYVGSKFERNKGWLTYYYQAFFLKLFGFSTFAARLPFLLLFPVALIFVVLLARRLFSDRVALIAGTLYAVNVYSIIAERQARYFSLLVVLTLWCLISIYRSITEKKTRHYLATAVGLVLLFYTHLVAFAVMGIFFIAAHVLYRRNLRSVVNRTTLLTLVSVAAVTIPWLLAVKFWTVVRTFTDYRSLVLWFVVVFLLSIAYLFYRLLLPITRHDFSRFSPTNYLILFTVTLTVVKPLLTPEESIASRLFIELNPILCIIIAVGAASLVNSIRSRRRVTTWIVNTATAILFFFLMNQLTPQVSPVVYETGWVRRAIAYLDERGVDPASPVFVSYQQFPFMLYSDYNVDTVWPVRKSYIDSYPGTVYFVFDYANFWPLGFYRDSTWKSLGLRDSTNLNFYARFQQCTKHHLEAHAFLYECPVPS